VFDRYRMFPKPTDLGAEIKYYDRVVRLNELSPPEPPLREPDPEHVARLSKSISEIGLIQPLVVVMEEGGRLVVIDGLHRFLALKSLYPEGEAQVSVRLASATNQNARYGLFLSAWKANQDRWENGVEPHEAFLRASILSFGEDVLPEITRGVEALRSLGEGETREYIDWVLEEGGPLDPVRSGWVEALASAFFRASIYLGVGMFGGTEGFLQNVLRVRAVQPKAEGIEAKPVAGLSEVDLEEVLKSKRNLSQTLKRALEVLKVVRKHKPDPKRPEVREGVKLVVEGLRKLEGVAVVPAVQPQAPKVDVEEPPQLQEEAPKEASPPRTEDPTEELSPDAARALYQELENEEFRLP